MNAPPTFTEADAQVLLDDADAYSVTQDPATGHYVCELRIDRHVGRGTGPERRVAVLAAVASAIALSLPFRCPLQALYRPPAG